MTEGKYESSEVEQRQREADPASEAFSVHDDESANWVIRKILDNRLYSEKCAEWYLREQARAKREEEFFLFRYGQQLMNYARQKIQDNGGRRKSVNLPAGMIGFRTEVSKLVIDDEVAVLSWAKVHKPALVSIIERLSKAGLNEHLEETGEMPDAGAHIEPAKEKFFVK
jgi:hypothetical protein